MPLSYLDFITNFPEFNTLAEPSYLTQSTQIALEVMNWDSIICLPTGSTLDVSSVKNLATSLYQAHVIATTNPSYASLATDDVKRVESLDNEIEFKDYKLSSAFDLMKSSYGVRLKAMLDTYSCKRIRDEEYEALTKVHEFAGIGEPIDSCCDDVAGFGLLW